MKTFDTGHVALCNYFQMPSGVYNSGIAGDSGTNFPVQYL